MPVDSTAIERLGGNTRHCRPAGRGVKTKVKETLKIKSSRPKGKKKRRSEDKNRKNLCLFRTLSVLAQKKYK
jgi:hypothetical protein